MPTSRISDPGHRSRASAHSTVRPARSPTQAPASFGRHRPEVRSADEALALQRLAGNRAVSRLLSTSTFVAGEDHPAERRAAAAERGASHSRDAGRLRSGSSPAGTGRPSPLASESGSPVPLQTAARLGLSGPEVSGIRLHQGSEADELNDALGSEGFTHGSDVFLSSQFYRQGTSSGNELLAHELSHARGPAASSGGLYMKKQKKYLDFLRFKRKETHIARMLTSMALAKVGATGMAQKVNTDKQGEEYDHYGHWWVEAGSLGDDTTNWQPAESYGWWPARGVGIAETLKINRVDGLLNQGDKNDPHHGESADLEFHPVMEVDDSESYEAIRDRVMGDVRNFATGFKGSWNWRLAWGKNCHTFQDRMKKSLGVHHQKAKSWLRGGGVQEEKPKPPKARSLAEIRSDLETMGIIGGGFGMLNMARDYYRNKFTLEEISSLTESERTQLVDAINGAQDGWNRARAADLNDFFSGATGQDVTFFKDGTEPDTSPKPTTEVSGDVSGASSGPTSSNPSVEVEHREPDIDEDRLRSFDKQVATLDKPLPTARGEVLAKGEKVLVMKVSSENKVFIERSSALGGGRFWIDGAAFLAAIVEDRGASGTTDIAPQTEMDRQPV